MENSDFKNFFLAKNCKKNHQETSSLSPHLMGFGLENFKNLQTTNISAARTTEKPKRNLLLQEDSFL